MSNSQKIITDIKNGTLKPIYFLHGTEAYFIDQISDYISQNILTEDERHFNQSIFYGRDVTIDQVVSTAKRYPMMADYQVVILKEAQTLYNKFADFTPYFKNPQSSTILVICHKSKKNDKRKSYYKAAKKNGVVFEGKPLYENQIPRFIETSLKNAGYDISAKAAHLLTEFLGTDLSKINNELEKLRLIVPAQTKITPSIVEKNIGISKDYNNFELQNALGRRDFKKAFRIIDYFSQNPKDNPILGTIPLLYRFFSNILKYHGLKDKSKGNVASKLGVHPFFVRDYVQAAKTFPMKHCSYAVNALRETDVKTKGVGASSLPQGDLLKEMLMKIAR